MSLPRDYEQQPAPPKQQRLPEADLTALMDQVFLFFQTCLNKQEFIPRLIRDGTAPTAAVELCQYLCFAHKERSRAFLKFFVEGTHRLGMDIIMFRPYFKVLRAFLSIRDTYQSWRVGKVVKILLKELEGLDPMTAKDTIKFLASLVVKLSNKDPAVLEKVIAQKMAFSKALEKTNWKITF